MNRLPLETRVRILSALVEGNSIRATSRMVGVSKDTAQKLLEDVGDACEAYHDENVRDLNIMLIQCDEIWTFCKAKESNIKPKDRRETIGDMWTWTAMDAQRKLVITWTLGKRTPRFARRFMEDLAGRVKTIVQISTDGFGMYKPQIQRYFAKRADYGMDIKTYGRDMETYETRYSPPTVIDRRRIRVLGVPDERYISTSIIERQNLTIENVDAAFHELDQWLLQEDGQPATSARAALHVLQFLPGSLNAQDDSGDCLAVDGPHLDASRSREPARSHPRGGCGLTNDPQRIKNTVEQ